MDHILLNPSSLGCHLCWFRLLLIVNSTAITMSVCNSWRVLSSVQKTNRRHSGSSLSILISEQRICVYFYTLWHSNFWRNKWQNWTLSCKFWRPSCDLCCVNLHLYWGSGSLLYGDHRTSLKIWWKIRDFPQINKHSSIPHVYLTGQWVLGLLTPIEGFCV